MGFQKVVKCKILLVEDDEDIRVIYTDILLKNGFDVITAVSGEDGFEKALKNSPDLILLDILLPIIDGLEMLKRLRKENEYGKNVPVIILTNLSPDLDSIVDKVVEIEPAYYMVKVKYSPQQVADKIKEVLCGITCSHESKKNFHPKQILIPALIFAIFATFILFSKDLGQYSLAALTSPLLDIFKKFIGL